MSDPLCPECYRPTIHRIGGEWCAYCRSFIWEVTIFYSTLQQTVRVLSGWQK